MDERTLDAVDMAHLRRAGEWGLLRSLGGRKVCMTGKMTMKRAQLATLVEAAGGVFADTVTRDLAVLVTANWGGLSEPPSTKKAKAQLMDVPVMTESEFAAELLPTPDELVSGVRASFGSPR